MGRSSQQQLASTTRVLTFKVVVCPIDDLPPDRLKLVKHKRLQHESAEHTFCKWLRKQVRQDEVIENYGPGPEGKVT